MAGQINAQYQDDNLSDERRQFSGLDREKTTTPTQQ